MRLDYLLVFLPAAVVFRWLWPDSHTLIFCTAALAIIPLAAWMGRATEHLAERTGEGVGGLLNATFGNAAELIIGLLALQRGLYSVVKASLTGSIIGNVLLVTGASVLAGGLKFKRQQFNATGARSQASMLTLAAIALIVPAAYHYLAEGAPGAGSQQDLSLEIAVVLMLTYALSLVFTLHTHKQLFAGERAPSSGIKPWPMKRALITLAIATALTAWASEILVGSVEAAAHSLGMTEIFVGVIIVAIVGNAAEHATAIFAARDNRMDLTLGIALGSSIQIALFVAPVLVFLSYALGPRPMDLVFSPAEVLAVGLSVTIAGQIAADGESNWLEGVQLLAVYAILGIVFFFLPEHPLPAAPAGHHLAIPAGR
jgi:Ca2+:H+ antiporter